MNMAASEAYASDPVTPELRAQYAANHMTVLWESSNAFGKPSEQAYLWEWDKVRPITLETAKLTSPAIIERRVINLVNPTIPGNDTDKSCGLMNAGIQALMPGELARPHRHSMHALRFVLEGQGAETIVEGKPCPMEPGDLVITPGFTWHEHRNAHGAPTVWVDILDVALHRVLGTAVFQPGPPNAMAPVIDDAAFVGSSFLPAALMDQGSNETSFSPLFRYPWAQARAAVAAAPIGADGSRKIRYANPVNGGSALPTIDCYLQELEDGITTNAIRTNASAVCVVVEGTGETKAGDTSFAWGPKDVFTLPQGEWISLRCTAAPPASSSRPTAKSIAASACWSKSTLPDLRRDPHENHPRRRQRLARHRADAGHRDADHWSTLDSVNLPETEKMIGLMVEAGST